MLAPRHKPTKGIGKNTLADQVKPKRRPNLTQSVVRGIRAQITDGALKPGDKLPTEQKLVEKFGVSRTVVREAIAGLRSDGLVEARHGVGVFVLDPRKANGGFRFLDEESGRISAIIETLELRAAVEIETAGLAAQRCSPGQEIRIRECFEDMQNAVERGKPAVDADFAFHMAIAEATNNPQFVKFLEYLGRRTIPRAQFRRHNESKQDIRLREQRLHDEHRAIMAAICSRNPEDARDAMRAHLKGSQERYHSLISSTQ